MGQLNIKDDALIERLRRLAERRQSTMIDVIRDAVTAVEAREEERVARRLAAIREITRRSAARLSPNLTSDHGWLYDEDGLPK